MERPYHERTDDSECKTQQNLLEWSQRVADCRSSGMAVTRWCAEHDINPKTYYTWQKKVFATMIDQQKQQQERSEETQTQVAELPASTPQNNLVVTVRKVWVIYRFRLLYTRFVFDNILW